MRFKAIAWRVITVSHRASAAYNFAGTVSPYGAF